MITAWSGPKDFSPPTANTGIVSFLARENFIVPCILGKRCELCKSSPHSPWLRVSGGKEISGRFVRFGGIAREVIPNSIEVDALTPSHEPFCIRTMKIEMPDSRVQQNLLPRLDPRNRCVH